jgi:putative spermidine/putrescine transport system substrate-binding protein
MFKKIHVGALALAGAAVLSATPLGAQEITVTAWGGAYTKSQEEAYYKPFTAKTGTKVLIQDYNGDLAEIAAQVKTGNVKWDVVDVELAEAIKGCEEGLFEKIDASKLPASDTGTPAAKDFGAGLITPCAVATIFYANVVAYDKAKLGAKGPKSLNDYFDLAKFPGKRGMRKNPSVNLEWALMADGVAPADVYKVLATPAGVDRAFKKLDTIKSSVVWWTAGAQPPQLLASGEVVMTSVYHGRIFDANAKDKREFALVWDGQVQVPDLFVIVKGTKNAAAAQEFVRFATSTTALAEQAKWIPYAPARASSLSKIAPATKEWLPNGGHSGRQMLTSAEFWSEYGDDLNKRFSAWLAK